MKNVTITLDEETARWARLEAARQEMSVSRLVRNLLHENMRQGRTYELARRRFLARPARSLNAEGAAYPHRDDLHDRAGLR